MFALWGIIILAEACLGIADPDRIQQFTAGIPACGFFLEKRDLSPDDTDRIRPVEKENLVMKKTYDVNIHEFIPMISPSQLKKDLPISQSAAETVITGRKTIQDIILKKDPRLAVITGPCSIHDTQAALDYARRLKKLQSKVEKTLFLIMRVYFEKPRTTIGWKGLINDPYLDGSCDMSKGLTLARRLLLEITELGMPTGTEMLDPITPQYIAGLVCWAAIGARTTESQTHREMASGLSMPVGFKNNTDGDLDTALNAMIAAASPQSFLGIDAEGKTSIVKTTGNPYTHLVLRGGVRPNYDSVSIREALSLLDGKRLRQAVVVDCSHANSRKQYAEQAIVWQDVINQRAGGNSGIIGMMLESYLQEGRQDNGGDPDTLQYGQSITDECISWDTTEALIMAAHETLSRSS
jgi:3-deoxy-7-phosphoheptulonate synthase